MPPRRRANEKITDELAHELALPSKKQDRSYPSSAKAITEKAVSSKSDLAALIGDPMTPPKLLTIRDSISQLTWNRKTKVAMTAVVKSHDMVMDSEVFATAHTVSLY